MNSHRFILPIDTKYINLPVEIKWDFHGRDDSIDIYENEVIEEVIGLPNDFEILRFSHEKYFFGLTFNDPPKKIYQTKIQYQFFFFSGLPINVTASTTNDQTWVNTYLDSLDNGFSKTQIYYYDKPFTKSFFKLDFYDSNTATTQTNYFTVILPVQQGFTENVSITPYRPNVDIKIPWMELDFSGNKEGFFLYWLRKKDFINLNTFFVSAKFFDARIGEFVRLMNKPQSQLKSKFQFDDSLYFYYKVVLDYNAKTYQYFLPDDFKNEKRLGVKTPIKWYEYVNPE